MKKIITIIFIILLPLINISAEDQKEIQLKKMIKEIYNFKPSKSSDEILNSKAKEMDKLWELVESNKNEYIPLLRKELQSQNYNSFFYYDGASLLLKNSQTNNDMGIVISAIGKSNLEDVQHYRYFQTVHWIACQNVDVFPAIENMLNSPDFKIFIPDHSLTLGQNYSVLYCLLCIDDNLYLNKLITRLKIEKNPNTLKTIILSIAYTISLDGQKALNEYYKTCDNPDIKKYTKDFLILENKKNLPNKEIKTDGKFFNKFINDLVSRKYDSTEYNFKEYSENAFYLVKKSDYLKIKKLRKNQAQRVSDEALGEIQFLTMLLQYSLTSND